jgi:hypothetical protein
MNNQEISAMQQRMALIKMAREMLNEEFMNKRGNAHAEWQQKSEELWREKGELLPYTYDYSYPTESDILVKAASLSKFIESGGLASSETRAVEGENLQVSDKESAPVQKTTEDTNKAALAERIKKSTVLSSAFYATAESPWTKLLSQPTSSSPTVPKPLETVLSTAPQPPAISQNINVKPLIVANNSTEGVKNGNGLQGPPINHGPLASTSPILPITEEQHNAAITNVQ